eukprot:g9752.t1
MPQAGRVACSGFWGREAQGPDVRKDRPAAERIIHPDESAPRLTYKAQTWEDIVQGDIHALESRYLIRTKGWKRWLSRFTRGFFGKQKPEDAVLHPQHRDEAGRLMTRMKGAKGVLMQYIKSPKYESPKMALIDLKRDRKVLPYKRRRVICQEWCDCRAIAIDLGCRKGDPDQPIWKRMFEGSDSSGCLQGGWPYREGGPGAGGNRETVLIPQHGAYVNKNLLAAPLRVAKGIAGGLFNFARKKTTGGEGIYEKTIAVQLCPLRKIDAEAFGTNEKDSWRTWMGNKFSSIGNPLHDAQAALAPDRVAGSGEMVGCTGEKAKKNGAFLEDDDGY